MMNLEKLSSATLHRLSVDIESPTYNRDKIRPGIFHFGVGGFHRSHQAVVMDNLFEMGLAHEWGICGVGVSPHGSLLRNLMHDQDGLYTLVEKESSGAFSYRVIGSIIENISTADSVEFVIERLTKPECRIVSLTITGPGYNINPATDEFDLRKVKDELKNPRQPTTVFGIVIEASRRRKERGAGGFTIMSCDNLPCNGRVAKKAFTSFANAVDLDLAKWMSTNVTFPNSMVDRITPVTTDADRKLTSEKLGLVDKWPVVCEPFIQWVLEDKFVNGRPPFEESFVQLVDDVEPYELMKLRLINAGHQAITYFGLMMDYQLVSEATGNALITQLLEAYMDGEATSTLMPVDIDLVDYKASVVERFQNNHIRDTLERLISVKSNRIQRFVMPVIADRLANKQSIWLSTAIVASFACYLIEAEHTFDINDQAVARLVSLSARLQKDASEISTAEVIFGKVMKNKVFKKAFKEIYEKIREDGCVKTIKWLLKKHRIAIEE